MPDMFIDDDKVNALIWYSLCCKLQGIFIRYVALHVSLYECVALYMWEYMGYYYDTNGQSIKQKIHLEKKKYLIFQCGSNHAYNILDDD